MSNRDNERPRRPRAVALHLAAALAVLLAACSSDSDEMPPDDTASDVERQEFAFTGTVVSVDTATATARVQNEEIPGWMMSMTMGYYVEPVEALRTLEPGDKITAKVYAGDTQHLYEVQVAPE